MGILYEKSSFMACQTRTPLTVAPLLSQHGSSPITLHMATHAHGAQVAEEISSTTLLGRIAVVHPGVSSGPMLSYTPVFTKFQTPSVIERFLQLQPDNELEIFLLEYCTGGETIFTDAMAHVLKWMQWSRTDINATLGRGQMYVISHQAVRSLLNASGHDNSWRPKTILDIGAGDGNVTRTALEPLLASTSSSASSSTSSSSTSSSTSSTATTATTAIAAPPIVTTEVSSPMATRLRSRGYLCVETADLGPVKETLQAHASSTNGTYDFISIFNVLDRADKPQVGNKNKKNKKI